MNKFEALGRYIDGKERLEALSREYQLLVSALDREILNVALFKNGKLERENNVNALENMAVLLPKCQSLQQDIFALTDEINGYAEICEKPKI